MPDQQEVADAVERLLEAVPEDTSDPIDGRLRARLAGYAAGLRDGALSSEA